MCKIECSSRQILNYVVSSCNINKINVVMWIKQPLAVVVNASVETITSLFDTTNFIRIGKIKIEAYRGE